MSTSSSAQGPELPFRWLDTVWIQVTGTLCNIACRHCFISCGPKATRVPVMAREAVERAVDEAMAEGARALYFTGGEPFLHPEIRALVEYALARAPLTVMTNGILLDDEAVRWLSDLFARSRYSLDLRVSLDGMSATQNDPVRGRGTFEQILAAIARLGRAGLSPVVTVVEHEEGLAGADARARFLTFLQQSGVRPPRVKFLPLLRIGREPRRTHGYEEPELLGTEPLSPEVQDTLMCSTSRTVTAQGVFTCPILIEDPSARMGETLRDAAHPLRLGWSACQTCVLDGLRCTT